MHVRTRWQEVKSQTLTPSRSGLETRALTGLAEVSVQFHGVCWWFWCPGLGRVGPVLDWVCTRSASPRTAAPLRRPSSRSASTPTSHRSYRFKHNSLGQNNILGVSFAPQHERSRRLFKRYRFCSHSCFCGENNPLSAHILVIRLLIIIIVTLLQYANSISKSFIGILIIINNNNFVNLNNMNLLQPE